MSLIQKKTNSINYMWRGYAEKNEYNHKLSQQRSVTLMITKNKRKWNAIE